MENGKLGSNYFTSQSLDRQFDFNLTLIDFHNLFNNEVRDDRTIAILGGTFLEMCLEHILYAFLPEEKEAKKLMEYNQPLGNFSNKISMVYCLGLIENVVREDLNLVRKIRNEFAHNLYASFENEKVKSWCNGLKWHKISLSSNPPIEATNLDLFQVGVNTMISHLNGCVSIARGEKRKVRNNF